MAIADTLVRDFDVNDLFAELTRACVDLLGASTAGLMLADHRGALRVMASSSETMRDLDLLEISLADGPGAECFAGSRAVIVDLRDPAAAQRWPRYTPEALRSGITGVRALPMRLRGDTIGALTLVHRTGRLDAPTTPLAQALADVATIAILQRRALVDSELLAEQLQAALNDRIVIEQAKGLLAERGRLPIEAAFTVLRGYCRSVRLPLTDTARELVTGQRDPDDVLASRWPTWPGGTV